MGVLPLILGLKEAGIKNIFVPQVNAAEAALAGDINIYGAGCLCDVVNHFGETPLKPTVVNIYDYLAEVSAQDYFYDF